MKSRALIFDLDGTLLDTLEDLTSSLNAALEAHGHPPLPARLVRRYVGDGLRTLILRALPRSADDPALIDGLAQAFREDYHRRWHQATRPYRGIPSLLRRLAGMEIPMAVLSNKPQEFCVNMVEQLLEPWHFNPIIGAGEEFPLKPDPAAALEIARRLDSPPGRCLLVGDSEVDISTALAAGMTPVGVTWGLRDEDRLRAAGASHILNHPEELLALL